MLDRLVRPAVARIRSLSSAQWALIALLGMAAFLRFYKLGGESLWLDELTTLMQTTWSPGRIISQAVVRGTPPLYYLLQLVVYHTLPPSEVSLRLLSAVADLVSVYLVYAIGRRLIGERAAIVAAGLEAVSIRVLWFAQEARAYSLGMMFTLLLVLTLIRLAERPGWARASVHAAVAVALLYTHVYSTFALIGIELAVLFAPGLLKRVDKYWYAAAGATAVAYVPWVFALGTQIGTRSKAAAEGVWSIRPPGGTIETVVKSVGEFAPGVYKSIPALGPSNWMVPLFVGLVFFGLLGTRAFRERETAPGGFEPTNWQRRALLLSWGGMLLVGGVLVSKSVLAIFSWRMATQAAPVLFLAAANGIRHLWRPAGLALLVAVLVFTISGLKPYYLDVGRGQVYEKENWRAAIAFAAENSPHLDAVLATPSWHVSRMAEYARMLGYGPLPPMIGIDRGLPSDRLDAQVQEAVEGRRRVLVVASHTPFDASGLTDVERALLGLGWTQESIDDVRMVHVRVYVR